MKHQGNFTRVKFEDKIYWRRGDGCWFFFGTSLLSLGFQEVRHSTHRKLEDAWVKNGLHFDSDAEIWKKKYEQLRAELEWEKEARQQQANLTEHRDLKKPKVVAGIDLGSKEGSYPAFVHMSNPTENNWVKDAFNEKAKEIGRKSAKFEEDLYYSLLPPHLMYDQGAPEGEVFEQAKGFLMTGNPQMIFAPSTRPVGQGSFQLVFDGKLQGEGFIGWKDNVYVCEFFPVEETKTKQDGYYIVKLDDQPTSRYECLVRNGKMHYFEVVGTRGSDINQIGARLSRFQGSWIPARFVTKAWHEEVGPNFDQKGNRTQYRVYPDVGVVHEDEFCEMDEDRDDFETVSVPDELIDYIEEQVKDVVKRRYEIGDVAVEETFESEEVSQAHKDYAAKTATFDIQQELERLSVGLRGPGKTATMFNRIRFLRKALIAKLAQVSNKEPTRPSEDDMMAKPDVPCAGIKEVIEAYDQHPQFRDIGIRIDRYGKMVFKPELVKGDEQ